VAEEEDVASEKVQARTRELLAGASRGAAWTGPRGGKHIPILNGGEVVGNLWEDVDLQEAEVGAYWAARFGVKAELVRISASLFAGSDVVSLLREMAEFDWWSIIRF
jgi:hypothetical protein